MSSWWCDLLHFEDDARVAFQQFRLSRNKARQLHLEAGSQRLVGLNESEVFMLTEHRHARSRSQALFRGFSEHRLDGFVNPGSINILLSAPLLKAERR
jgi:hypothetical protein